MTILARDLRWYGSSVMPDTDLPINVGGAIALDRQVQFTSVSGFFQLVSDDAGDTESVLLFYRDVGHVIQAEAKSLTGTTPVLFVARIGRLLKATKGGPTTGNVAIEAQTATRVGTAQSGTVDGITLDAGASAIDNAYRSKIIRLTGGTGAPAIRRVVSSDGTTKEVLVTRPFVTPPDATTTFRISDGLFFEVEPDECLEVRRLHYDAGADQTGGNDRMYYEKVFIKNLAINPLFAATVAENADPEGQFDFALESGIDGIGTNSGNRQQAPAGVTAFNGVSKAVPGVDLAGGSAIGVWSRLGLPAGDISTDSRVAMQISGA